jgi:hypothetical protein
MAVDENPKDGENHMEKILKDELTKKKKYKRGPAHDGLAEQTRAEEKRKRLCAERKRRSNIFACGGTPRPRRAQESDTQLHKSLHRTLDLLEPVNTRLRSIEATCRKALSAIRKYV